ncbi:hypothetical protein [Maridesulfovibrio sp. FT414]|uniref:hypothetical protein n=1 Tax=Maridesulfovibrio sp. FT414 TaxID=2979469 RepID=UPI003D806EC4
MKWIDWLNKWKFNCLKIKAPFLEMEWAPQEADKKAAWELYIELLTRVATQQLPQDHGNEEATLKSIYSLFDITRDVIKRNGKECKEFTKIAVVVLNQVIRPFTSKWHKKMITQEIKVNNSHKQFYEELIELQLSLKTYTRMLAEMAEVEDLTDLET